MSRRAATFAVVSIVVLILIVVGVLLPVPYVVLMPGPTYNTLGPEGHKPLILIKGHKAYPDKGHLNLVTVAYRGSPTDEVDLFTALRGWVDPTMAVLPQRLLFPTGEPVKQVLQRSKRLMSQSQQDAIAAALRALHVPVTRTVTVVRVEKGDPAHGVLRKGDRIVAVDGRRTDRQDQVAGRITAHRPGEHVRLTVVRNGKIKHLTVGTARSHGKNPHAIIGVWLQNSFHYPFQVNIRLRDVGGPSAGMMFALGVIDKLTPGSLTGGRFIAGTGTITASGEVGEIGGIQQKMVGARDAGATVFLTPAANCRAALQSAPSGLRLVKVTTLHGALEALKALRTGHGAVPSCR